MSSVLVLLLLLFFACGSRPRLPISQSFFQTLMAVELILEPNPEPSNALVTDLN